MLMILDEKMTNRNIYFVSIRNSSYTQCIGAPFKKTSFFSKRFFFLNIFKKATEFFSSTESKESSVHEQATTEFLIMSCKERTQLLKFISSLNQKNKNKSIKTRSAACCLPRTLRLHKQLLIFKTQDI